MHRPGPPFLNKNLGKKHIYEYHQQRRAPTSQQQKSPITTPAQRFLAPPVRFPSSEVQLHHLCRLWRRHDDPHLRPQSPGPKSTRRRHLSRRVTTIATTTTTTTTATTREDSLANLSNYALNHLLEVKKIKGAHSSCEGAGGLEMEKSLMNNSNSKLIWYIYINIFSQYCFLLVSKVLSVWEMKST